MNCRDTFGWHAVLYPVNQRLNDVMGRVMSERWHIIKLLKRCPKSVGARAKLVLPYPKGTSLNWVEFQGSCIATYATMRWDRRSKGRVIGKRCGLPMFHSGDGEQTIEIIHLNVCMRTHERVDGLMIAQGGACTDHILSPASIVQKLTTMFRKSTEIGVISLCSHDVSILLRPHDRDGRLTLTLISPGFTKSARRIVSMFNSFGCQLVSLDDIHDEEQIMQRRKYCLTQLDDKVPIKASKSILLSVVRPKDVLR